MDTDICHKKKPSNPGIISTNVDLSVLENIKGHFLVS